jgi:type II secretion system protein H
VRAKLTTSRSKRRGFTLLELVLVMLIISVAMGSIAPSMRTFAESRKTDEAAEYFAMTARWARQQAVSDAATYQINIDPANRTWRAYLVVDNVASEISGEMGREFTADESVQMTATDFEGKTMTTIVFEPNGRVAAGQVRFAGDQGNSVVVRCDSSLEDYRLAEGGE